MVKVNCNKREREREEIKKREERERKCTQIWPFMVRRRRREHCGKTPPSFLLFFPSFPLSLPSFQLLFPSRSLCSSSTFPSFPIFPSFFFTSFPMILRNKFPLFPDETWEDFFTCYFQLLFSHILPYFTKFLLISAKSS